MPVLEQDSCRVRHSQIADCWYPFKVGDFCGATVTDASTLDEGDQSGI